MKKVIFLLLVVFCFSQLNAQQFLTPSAVFSGKEPAYITLKDGTEIKGTIKLKRKKGQIESVTVDDGVKKQTLKADKIAYMYLMPSGFDKLAKTAEFLTNAKKWNNEKLNNDLLDQGYVYFESTGVKIKKKNYNMMMQVLNPSFSKGVIVFNDPFAKETASLGVAGIKVVGGDAKSYYVKKAGDPVAYVLTMKDYKKEFPLFWKGCDAVISQFPTVKWTELPKHIVAYTEECAK